jgi:hypothetical protein
MGHVRTGACRESIVSWARPVGILTDRDLIARMLTRTDRIPATTTLAEVMQHDVIITSAIWFVSRPSGSASANVHMPPMTSNAKRHNHCFYCVAETNRTVTQTGRVLYTASAHTTGGRESGASRTNDGHLDPKKKVRLAVEAHPKASHQEPKGQTHASAIIVHRDRGPRRIPRLRGLREVVPLACRFSRAAVA